MIHLMPLPGSPDYSGDFDSVLEQAATDAATLMTAGFDGLMLENFGDAPFFADQVPAVTVAAMTRAASVIRTTIEAPLGINVLRNDAISAMSIAAAVDAQFIRVNVLSGTMYTDQGPIVGRAAEVARLRAALGADVAILADVFVKHAVPPAGLTLEQAADELTGRGGADAVIASGSSTGKAPSMVHIKETKAAIGDLPLFLGSGVNATTAKGFLDAADGLIVGSATKPGGAITSRVDPELAAEIVRAVS
ncbi:MAG: BtpA/SgcQ family protein [Acidimicrobiia bacterium]|nr:BtpA/SgcQ family protein [Acidimicrobiia bacterium]